MNDTVTGELLIREDHVLAQFREFDQSLAEFTSKYMDRVYDLDNPAENKAARSDRLAIGRVVAELDRRHASIKAPLLEATRVVDGERKRIKDALLDVQGRIKTQIEAHEQREKDRIAALGARVSEINDLTFFDGSPDSATVAKRLDAAKAIALDESWQELRGDAALARTQAIETLERLLVDRQKAEAEAAELARLRAEAEAKERQEREERIAREAAEAARAEAEAAAKAEAERVEQERREAEEQAAHARAEAQRESDEARERLEREAAEAQAAAARALAEAEERAARAAAEERARIEREQQEREREAAKARKADEARKEKRQHRAKIHGEVKRDLIAAGLDEATATMVVEVIRDGKIAHVAIAY